MSNHSADVTRARMAAEAIIDGRDPVTEHSSIMVTAEHAFATLLLALYRDPKVAAGMLNEGLVQGIESRLALYASKHRQGK